MTRLAATTRIARTVTIPFALLLVPAFASAQTAWPTTDLVPDESDDARSGSAYGTSTAVNGGTAMVGASEIDGHGAVYVFQQHGAQWTQVQKLLAPDMAAGRFGSDIVFKENTALISDHERNLVYVFDRASTTARFYASAILRGGVELFGSAIALEGCVALVSSGAHGAPTGHGYVHVYNRCPSGKWVYQGSFVSPDASPQDLFGASLALSGSNLLVGAPGTAANAGAAYHYVYSNGAWRLKQKLTQASPHAGNQFGRGVGLRNGLAAVGAPYTLSTGEGEVSLYERVNDSWVPSGLLYAPDSPGSGATTQFGFRIRVTDDRVYINSEPIDYYRMPYTLTIYRRVGDGLQLENQFGAIDDYRDTRGESFDVAGRTLIIGNPTQQGPRPFEYGGGAAVYQVPPP
jgi:hypothetical protein